MSDERPDPTNSFPPPPGAEPSLHARLRAEWDQADAGAADDPESEPAPPRRRGRHPLVAVAMLAAIVFALYKLAPHFVYGLSSAEAVDLGDVVEWELARGGEEPPLERLVRLNGIRRPNQGIRFGSEEDAPQFFPLMGSAHFLVRVAATPEEIEWRSDPGAVSLSLSSEVFEGRLRRLERVADPDVMAEFYATHFGVRLGYDRENRPIPVYILVDGDRPGDQWPVLIGWPLLALAGLANLVWLFRLAATRDKSAP